MCCFAICEDDGLMRSNLYDLLEEYLLEHKLDYSIDEYDNTDDLLMSNKKYDMIFMDYQFDNISIDGLEAIREIRDWDVEVSVVFVSSHPDIVFSIFEVDAFDFIKKPVVAGEIDRVLNRFIKAVVNQKYVSIKSHGSSYFLSEKDIVYVEANGKKSIIYLLDDKIECWNTLSDMEKKLSATFGRPHRSFLVNLRYVKESNKENVFLKNGSVIPVGRVHYNKFLEMYLKNCAR